MDTDEAILLMERVVRAKEIVNLDEEIPSTREYFVDTAQPIHGAYGVVRGIRIVTPALRTRLARQPPPNMPFFLSLASQLC